MIAIAAVARNLVIGKNGQIPWRSKEDLHFFKEMTLGKKIVVGRKTFDGLPKLAGREVYVLSASIAIGSQIVNQQGLTAQVTSFDNVVHGDNSEYIVCGGASIYNSMLLYCDTLYLTYFNFDVEGDTTFPYNFNEIRNIFPYVGVLNTIQEGVILEFAK